MTSAQAAAVAELGMKSLEQIHTETAYLWAYRAWAARTLELTQDSVEYAHEALEHAALSGSDATLVDVRRVIRGGEQVL